MNFKRLGSGFTLIELMITVSIIGILASIAIPKFADLVRKSKEGATKGSLGALRSALSIYYSDMESQFPQTIVSNDALTVLTIKSKYLTGIPNARVADYHADNSTEADRCLTCGGFSPLDLGNWLYDSTPGDPGFGTVWVDCTHTDTKGSVWTLY